jgi:hypothetical protein
MSDRPIPKLPDGVLTEEQVAKISGGDCTVQDYISILDQLKGSYESLIDFTSYVIERVEGP